MKKYYLQKVEYKESIENGTHYYVATYSDGRSSHVLVFNANEDVLKIETIINL